MSNSKLLKVKVVDDAVYYDGTGEFVFLVPEIYFERQHAIVTGEYINMIGVLNYNIISSEDEDVTKDMQVFKYPSVFLSKPGKMEKIKNLKFPEGKPEDYRILHYSNNGYDQIICNINTPQDVSYVEEFMQIFVKTGKVPKNIPYDTLHEYYLENMALNGGDYGISAQEFGVLVSELCRDPSNESRPYRLSKHMNANKTNYIPISIKELSKIVSPFTSIATENWDEAVVNAGLIEDNDVKYTPMERIMMGD